MKRVFVALAIAAAGLLPTSSLAQAVPNVLVSTTNPFAACKVGQNPTGTATNYPGAEVEPFVTVDPTHPGRLLSAWQQDRWSDGGAHGLAAGWSNDGGRTWTDTPLPFSKCAGQGAANYERASDPGVAVGPDGKAYAISLSFDGDSIRNAVYAATSSDSGHSWGGLTPLKVDVADPVTGNPFNDKELIFADPSQNGTAYAVWDRLADLPGPLTAHRAPERDMPAPRGRTAATRPSSGPRQRANDAAGTALPVLPDFTGPTWLARTTDGGKTWEQSHIIVPTGRNEQTIGNYVVVNPKNGLVYDFFTYFDAQGTHIEFVVSADHGVNWSQRHRFQDLMSVGVGNVRTGDIIPIPAVDPASGNLYMVWQDARFSGQRYDEVVISRSTDGGLTWSAPALVNDHNGQPAFTGTVAVNSDGRVGVTYYQGVNYTPATATTPAGCPSPATQACETTYNFKLGQTPGLFDFTPASVLDDFDMTKAPVARGYFVGDYEGLTTVGKYFRPVWVSTTGGGGTAPRARPAIAGRAADPAVPQNATQVYTTPPLTDLILTKSTPSGTYVPGQQVSYTISVNNAGPSQAIGIAVTDNLPAGLTNASWTCSTGSVDSACGAPSGTGNINQIVSVAPFDTVTFTVTATAASNVGASLTNTASLNVPAANNDIGCTTAPTGCVVSITSVLLPALPSTGRAA